MSPRPGVTEVREYGGLAEVREVRASPGTDPGTPEVMAWPPWVMKPEWRLRPGWRLPENKEACYCYCYSDM